MSKASSAIARIALTSLLEPQVEHRPHMQAADRGVRIPGAAGAVLLEDVGEPRGIVREMLERHRAVLDERDRFALLLHRHHDVEAGGAHLGDRGLQRRDRAPRPRRPISRRSCPRQAEIAHQLAEPLQAAQVLVLVVLGELDEQDRLGIAAHERVDASGGTSRSRARARAWCGRPARPRSARACTMCCAASIAVVEAAEMAGADRAPAEQRRKLQLDLGGEAERALGADQNMREIEIVAAGHQRIEIVAADPALHLRKARLDLVGLARAEREQIARERHAAATAAAGRRGRARPDRNAQRCRRPAPRRSRARSRACCRSAASARRRNCCRPCRRWWRARRSRCRPETTGRAACSGD